MINVNFIYESKHSVIPTATSFSVTNYVVFIHFVFVGDLLPKGFYPCKFLIASWIAFCEIERMKMWTKLRMKSV